MRYATTTALAVALIATLGACKQSAAPDAASTTAATTGSGTIDGTWKADIDSVKIDAKPDEVMLKDGTFNCLSCTPPYKVAADGAFHPVSGLSYADEVAVKVDSDSKVTETDKKAGKVVNTASFTVSPDGKTTTIEYTDTSVEGGKPVSGKVTQTRVGEAPAGAHAISGKWSSSKIASVSDEGITMTFKLDGDTLHMTSPDGTSYDAKLGGPAVPIKGDIGGTMIAASKTGDNTYKLAATRDGKPVNTVELTVDGDVTHVKSHNERNGNTTTYDMKRQ